MAEVAATCLARRLRSERVYCKEISTCPRDITKRSFPSLHQLDSRRHMDVEEFEVEAGHEDVTRERNEHGNHRDQKTRRISWPAPRRLPEEFPVGRIEQELDGALFNICLYIFGKPLLQCLVAFRFPREGDEHLGRVDLLG